MWKFIFVASLAMSIPLPGFGALSADSCASLASALIPSANAAHEAITHDLYSGQITAVRKHSENGNRNPLFLVTLKARDSKTGRERSREAFFKPRIWGDGFGYNRTPMEFVAYDLNRRLGMDYVPPTAYRIGLNIEYGGQKYTEGAFLVKVSEFQALENYENWSFGKENEAVRSDNRILNILLQNPDSHIKNLGIGNHWVDGLKRSIFLDFGASFLPGALVTLDSNPSYGNEGRVEKIRRQTFENLKKLTMQDFVGVIRVGFITRDEVKALLDRRDALVLHFKTALDEAAAKGLPESSIILPE